MKGRDKILSIVLLLFAANSNVCAQKKKVSDNLPARFTYTVQVKDKVSVKGYRIKGYPMLFVPLTTLIKDIPGNQIEGHTIIKTRNFLGLTVGRNQRIAKIDLENRLVFIEINKWAKKQDKGIEEDRFLNFLRNEVEDEHSVSLVDCQFGDCLPQEIEPKSIGKLGNIEKQRLTDFMGNLEALEDLEQYANLLKDSSECNSINPMQLEKTRVQLKVEEKLLKLLRKKERKNKKWRNKLNDELAKKKQHDGQLENLNDSIYQLDSILKTIRNSLDREPLLEEKKVLQQEAKKINKALNVVTTKVDKLNDDLGSNLTNTQSIDLAKYRTKLENRFSDQYGKMESKFGKRSSKRKINDKRFFNAIVKAYYFYKHDNNDRGLKYFAIKLAISEITDKFSYPDENEYPRVDNSTTVFFNALAKYHTYMYHKNKGVNKPEYLSIAYEFADHLKDKLQQENKADQLNGYESDLWNRYIGTDFEDEAIKLIRVITSEFTCESLKQKAKEYEDEQRCWEALALYREAMKTCCPNEVLFKKVEKTLAEMEKFYLDAINKADSFLDQGEYLCAAKLFTKASQIKPRMDYPKDKMREALHMANQAKKAQMDKIRYDNIDSFIKRLIRDLLQRYEYIDLPNNEFNFPNIVSIQDGTINLQLDYGMASKDLVMFATRKNFIPSKYKAEKTAQFIIEVLNEIHSFLGDLIIGTTMRIEGHADAIPYRGKLKYDKRDFSRSIDHEVTITDLGKGKAFEFEELLAIGMDQGDVNPSMAHIREIWMKVSIQDAYRLIDTVIAVSKAWKGDPEGDGNNRRTNVGFKFTLDSIRYQELSESDLDTMDLPCKEDMLVSPCVDYIASDTLINDCGRIVDSKRRDGGKYYALLIAIDQYKKEPSNYRVAGAKAIHDILISKYDFDSQNVYSLYNEAATLQAIQDKLEFVGRKLNHQDNFLIYFSGEGEFYEKQGYWLPYDAVNLPRKKKVKNALSNQYLQKYFKENRAQHIQVISESSYSGSLIQQENGRSKQMSLPELYGAKSRTAFVSNGPLERSPVDGVFTNKLISVLQSMEEDCFEAKKLGLEVIKALKNDRKYHSQYGKVPLTLNKNDLLKGMGDFVFMKKAK